jgi:endonuclease/exonuclease/phosphatase family metal-dependent hydrolase
MRKQWLLMSVVAGLFVLSHVLVSAEPKEKPRNKKKAIEVVNLNILHGFACDPPFPGDGDQCRVRDRVDLLVEHLIAAGCPDIVTLQENVTKAFVPLVPPVIVGPLINTVALIQDRLPRLAATCGFRYKVVFDPEGLTGSSDARGIDEELILTRYPVLHAEVFPLYSPLAPFFFRHALYARIDHAVEPLDVFTTHLAADSDFGSLPCGINVLPSPLESPPCPAECVVPFDTVRECETKQLVHFIETRHDIPGPAIVTGDFNAAPGSNVYNQVVSRGWVDSHLAAGNLECDPTTGLDCTAGRVDNNLSDLESPDLNQTERIDFIFVVPPEADSPCPGVIQTSDRPGVTTTGLFAAEPNPFTSTCGAAPLPICWASDHSGNALNLNCQPSANAPGHSQGSKGRAESGSRPRQEASQ